MKILFREALAEAGAHKVTSLLIVTIVFVSTLAILLTAGRAAGAERQIAEDIDSTGLRTIIFDIPSDRKLQPNVLKNIEALEKIVWLAGFGPPQDVTSGINPKSQKIVARTFYASDKQKLLPENTPEFKSQTAYASPEALNSLGIPDGVGFLTLETGTSVNLAGTAIPPEFLKFMEPTVLLTPPTSTTSTVNTQSPDERNIALIVAVAEKARDVKQLQEAIIPLIANDKTQKIGLRVNDELLQINKQISERLNAFSWQLVSGILLTAFTVISTIMSGLILLTRKDFGRRRVLGATRTDIFTLITIRITLLALAGSTAASISAAIILTVQKQIPPALEFFTAVSVLTTGSAMLASLLPSTIATRKQAILELRTA